MPDNMNETYVKTGLEIAVIGISGRFPGASNIHEFWNNLINGMESISFFSDEELAEADIPSEWLENPSYVKANAVVEDSEYFDASFFGYAPGDAELMDPQIRIFHECTWQALEDAGYNPFSYGGLIGVYAGASENMSWKAKTLLFGEGGSDGITREMFSSKDFLSMLLSYNLNLRGPSSNISNACSTSLVAVHMACRGLLNGDCDMAVAGGVSISVNQKTGYWYQEGMIMSQDGHMRSFDADATGIVFGNGIGVVVLKLLEDASAHRDHIYAVVKGSASNNDGNRRIGFTAPSVKGQTEVIRTALQMSMVEPSTISYVETHGSATNLGDPIEVKALTQAFNIDSKNSCGIGSVKTNVGHLISAAGIAGFIKTVLTLKHKKIPPSLYYVTPNPEIDFENSPFYVNAELREWKNNTYPLRAAVSSFGLGGTNAHVILEEAPLREESSASRPFQLLLLSARTESALERGSTDLRTYLQENPGINLADAAFTLQVGRKALSHRRMLVCSDVQEAVEMLASPGSGQVQSFMAGEKDRPVVFMFSGQGSQYVNMGLSLYREEAAFRQEMDRCFGVLENIMGTGVRDFLYPPKEQEQEGQAKIDDVLYSGPIKFIFEYSLARLLIKWGIRPHALIGHSFGEYAAACLAEVFSLEDALKLVVLRGQLMEKTRPGKMLSIPLAEEELKSFLPEEISLAAVNTKANCIISGPMEAVDSFEKKLNKKGYECIRINFPRASHSKLMAPIADEFRQVVEQIKLNQPKIPYIAGLTGTWVTDSEALAPDYWTRHLMETIRFDDGLGELLKEADPVFVQMSSDRGLTLFTQQHPGLRPNTLVINLVKPKKEEVSDVYYLLRQLGQLWLYGKSIDWPEFYGQEKRYRVPLPTYSFERQRYWIEGDPFKLGAEMLNRRARLVPKPDMADWFYIPSWTRALLPKTKGEDTAKPCRWLIFMDECGLGIQLKRRLAQEGHRITVVKTGTRFEREGDGTFTINPALRSDYHSLVSELLTQDIFPEKIVHLWSVTDREFLQQFSDRLTMVDRFQEIGFYSLLYLMQAIGEQGIVHDLQVEVITNNMQEVNSGDLLYPEKATILGAVKVISAEYPTINCRSIDIVLTPPDDQQEKAPVNQLLTEFAVEPANPIVAYRGRYRWEQIYKAVRLDTPTDRVSRFKEKGTYFITGGLGGIGLVLAEYLARTIKPKLVLVGRSPLPPREEWPDWVASQDGDEQTRFKITKVKELENHGAEVLVIGADVSDAGQVRKAVSQAKKRFGKIDGLLHCAGIADHGGIIQRRTREITDVILAAKIKGALLLDDLLKDEGLNLMVFCSSVNGIIPAFGQVGHCGANTFLDAFSFQKSAAGDCFTVSINWNAWKEVGQAAKAAENNPETLGNGVTNAEGVEVFCRILDHTFSQVAVSNMDLMALIEQSKIQFNVGEAETEIVEEDQTSVVLYQRPELDIEYITPTTEIEEKTAGIFQSIFRYDRVGIDDDFFKLGGDSLKAMTILTEILKAFQVKIPITVFYNKPTIRELAEHISLNIEGENEGIISQYDEAERSIKDAFGVECQLLLYKVKYEKSIVDYNVLHLEESLLEKTDELMDFIREKWDEKISPHYIARLSENVHPEERNIEISEADFVALVN